MALRVLVYRLLDGGLASCLETSDEHGVVTGRKWFGYRGDGGPQAMEEPRDRIGPIRVVDVPDR